MSDYYRQVFEHAPSMIEVPAALRQRRVEIIMLAIESPLQDAVTDSAGMKVSPDAIYSLTEGRWEGELPLLESEGDYETRLEMP